MDYAALRARLEEADILGLSDAEILAAVNARTLPGSVDAVDVKRELLLAGKWPAIVIAARANNPAAVNITEALDSIPSFDLAVERYLAAITAGLQVLVDVPLITVDEMAACLALGQNKRSLADVWALGPLDLRAIVKARAV